ncbi:NUDIX domain-containing protein [Streptomyces sp. CS081A]|uniref:NUDIX domain-containing protein n=1 Tax=Streptomyces sp. CS081A TaxID=2162709 RepID=UPI000D51A7A6|nr:NUDIX domain-containing protein [Streptomyces sp. CS081A]PVC71840.1 NUDIX hydrolase [Streptomyces sp. CS081A]
MSNSVPGARSTSPLHSVSVAGAVVREDGRLLAIRRADNGTWELPGGVLEVDEIPQGGVVREVFEETGVRVEVGELTGVYKNLARGIVALVFRCRPVGGGARVSDEATAVEWLTPGEVRERMAEVYAVRLLDALDGAGPHVRAHDGRRFVS